MNTETNFRYSLVGISVFSVFKIPTSVSVSVFENNEYRFGRRLSWYINATAVCTVVYAVIRVTRWSVWLTLDTAWSDRRPYWFLFIVKQMHLSFVKINITYSTTECLNRELSWFAPLAAVTVWIIADFLRLGYHDGNCVNEKRSWQIGSMPLF